MFCVNDVFVVIDFYHPIAKFHCYHLYGVFSPLFVIMVSVLL